MQAFMAAQDSLESLVRRAQGGDREAFDALVRRHQSGLRRHARARIGPHLQSRVEVDDVLQETFARAWRSIGAFRWTGEGEFLAWLKVIAEHVILKLARRHGRDRLIFRPENPSSDQPSPSQALRRRERFQRLEEAIQRLEPDYREAVRLVRLQGLKIKEAAARMGRTPKSVMHLVSRGLKQLRGLVGDTESLHLEPPSLRGEGGTDEVD